MKTLLKKSIYVSLSVLIMLSVTFSFSPMATASTIVKSGASGNCTWNLDDEGVLTISGNGEIKNNIWNISDRKDFKTIIIEKGVTSIGYAAFSSCNNVTNIFIPDTISTIGEKAFENCSSLTTIIFPNGISNIAKQAFISCDKLKTVYIPSSVKQIDEKAFGYTFNSSVYRKIEDITIYTQFGSVGMSYAINNGFKIVLGVGCAYCQKIIEDKNIIKDSGISPTCTETGLTEGCHCSICGNPIIKQEVIPSSGHNYIGYNKPPSCTEKGYTKYVCKVCGDTYDDNFTDPINHNYNINTIKDASCTEEGEIEYCCDRCGHSFTEPVKKTPHTVVIDSPLSPTCTESGLTEGSHCSVCGEVISKQETIPATGHKPIIVPSIPVTCQHDGQTKGSICEYCGLVYLKPQVIPKLEHTKVTDNEILPTCTKSGLTEGSHCSVCGEVIQPQEIITALGHDYQLIEGKPASYTETGLSDGIQCSRCGEWLISQEIIPLLDGLFGDTNLDGTITIRDVTAIQRHLAEFDKFTEEQLALADTNGDGKINISDATHLQMYLAEYDVVIGKS